MSNLASAFKADFANMPKDTCQPNEPPAKMFALNLYRIHASCVTEDKRFVEYTIESQVVFLTGSTDDYARNVYSEFLEPGWQIGAVTEVPAIETLKHVCL